MKVLVGMSGGVDSTIAAYILKKQGHEVVGCHLNFLDVESDLKINDVGVDLRSPRMITDAIGIELIEKNYSAEFKDKIINSFVNDYKNGITPNPCALCNGTMKFQKLLEVMKEVGADKIATGHYAGVVESTRYAIRKSKNTQKDQSYMLYTLTQDQLSHLILPIGDMSKDEVRSIARELNLEVADKKDSQDVCFVEENDYKEFIKCNEFGFDYKEKIARGELKEEEILSKPYFKSGEFVDTKGNILGYHKGIINYTIGQRKGLNIAFGERKFVLKIDIEKNQVVLGDNDDLMSKEFSIRDVNYQGVTIDDIKFNSEAVELIAKLRYRHDGTTCHLIEGVSQSLVGASSTSPVLNFILDANVRAVTPGQAAVIYDKNGTIMLGGTII